MGLFNHHHEYVDRGDRFLQKISQTHDQHTLLMADVHYYITNIQTCLLMVSIILCPIGKCIFIHDIPAALIENIISILTIHQTTLQIASGVLMNTAPQPSLYVELHAHHTLLKPPETNEIGTHICSCHNFFPFLLCK